MDRANVASVTPLTIRLKGSATAIPAQKLTGITYTPVIGDAVIVAFMRDNGVPIVLGPVA